MTVISHIKNEEYLLPWWLEHHTKIFDHGIIIDYHSTDRSVEVINSLAPTWKIVKSDVDHFGAHDADRQVMEVEKSIDGWKVALNTTEFLFGTNIREKLKESVLPIRCTGIYLVDPEGFFGKDPDPDQPLLKQRYYGMTEKDGLLPAAIPARERLIHNRSTGMYTLGRHTSNWDSIQDPSIFCVWLGFSPFTDKFIERKLAIRKEIPEAQIASGGGISHYSTKEQLLNERFGWNSYKDKIVNLLDNPDYNKVWRTWYGL